METEGFDCLALRLSRGVGELQFHRLVGRFGSATATLAAPVVALMDAGLPRAFAVQLADGHGRRLAEAELRRARELDVQLCCFGDPDYPEPLRELEDPPPVLWLRGVLPGPDARRLGIVGTRAPDGYGVAQALRLGRAAAQAGLWVVSGGARGIDAAAHEGALRAGGHTLVVVGAGVDVPYPAEHGALFADVVQRGGGLLSELPLGTSPRRGTFPRRNRLIAALCEAIVVVQLQRSRELTRLCSPGMTQPQSCE